MGVFSKTTIHIQSSSYTSSEEKPPTTHLGQLGIFTFLLMMLHCRFCFFHEHPGFSPWQNIYMCFESMNLKRTWTCICYETSCPQLTSAKIPDYTFNNKCFNRECVCPVSVYFTVSQNKFQQLLIQSCIINYLNDNKPFIFITKLWSNFLRNSMGWWVQMMVGS